MAVQVPISNTFISSELFTPDDPRRLTAALGPCVQLVNATPPGGVKWGDHWTSLKGLTNFDFNLAVSDQWHNRTATNYGSTTQATYHEKQPYRLTKLLKSYCRLNDQQLPACMKTDITPMRVLSSVDPYWSHRSIFEVFPATAICNPNATTDLSPATRHVLLESVKDRQRSTYTKSYPPHPIDAILKSKTEIEYPGLGRALIDVESKRTAGAKVEAPPKPTYVIPESTETKPDGSSISWPPKAYQYEKHFQLKEDVDRFISDEPTKEESTEPAKEGAKIDEIGCRTEDFHPGSLCEDSNVIRRLCPCDMCHQFRKRVLKRQEDELRHRNYHKEISDFQQSVARLDTHGVRPAVYHGGANLHELFSETNRGKELCTNSIRKMQTNVRAFRDHPMMENMGSLPSGLPLLVPASVRKGPVKYGLMYRADMCNNHRLNHRDHVPDLRRNHVARKKYVFNDYHAQTLRGNCPKIRLD